MKNLKSSFLFYNTDRDNVSRHVKADVWHHAMLSINDPVWHRTFAAVLNPIVHTTYALRYKPNEKH